MPQYTQDQIDKLQSLGINIQSETLPLITPPIENLISLPTTTSRPKSKNTIFPLLSISGLTLLSFSGLILLKGKGQTTSSATNQPESQIQPSSSELTPTQVPKSIQHYLLTSQQLFSQALQLQQQPSPTGADSTINLLNQSILAATEAIKEFPKDYRGYQQRGRIYQSLTDSQPNLIDQSIADLATAQKLNPESAEITHTLASLYAKKGDAQNTIIYLNKTVSLEPTKAQNFYDLAKIQQQAGYLPQALETYNRLVTIVTDVNQKAQIESEKSTLEKIISENPNLKNNNYPSDSSTKTDPSLSVDAPTIQAMTDGGLIVAAPEDDKNIEVKNQTDSNSLAGNSKLASGQKEIVITNNNVSSTSQVYVTATKGGKNQNLQVLSKSDKSFTIGFDSPLNEEVEFKWWIIN